MHTPHALHMKVWQRAFSLDNAWSLWKCTCTMLKLFIWSKLRALYFKYSLANVTMESWKLGIVSNRRLLPSFFRWSLKKKTKQQQQPANGKEACLKFVKGIARFLFGKTFVLNCALRWNFQLTLLDKITIQFRLFIGFVHEYSTG